MLRGNLSTRPQPICAIDFRLLLDAPYGYGQVGKRLPAMLLAGDFDKAASYFLPWRPGAKRWLQRNWSTRFMVVSINLVELAPLIDMIFEDVVAETTHFSTREDLREWLPQTPEVYRLFTNDTAIISLDGITRRFNRWSEKP